MPGKLRSSVALGPIGRSAWNRDTLGRQFFRIGNVAMRKGCVPVFDDHLVKPESALNAPPSLESAATFVNIFLDQKPCALRTPHNRLLAFPDDKSCYKRHDRPVFRMPGC